MFRIDSYAFNSISLTTLYLPPNIVTFAEHAVTGNSITSLDFSQLQFLETISAYSFVSNSLTSVILTGASSLITIGDRAFDLNQITTADFTGLVSLSSIGNDAFIGNPLSSVIFAGCSSLISIGSRAFSSPPSSANNQKMTSLDLSPLTALTTIRYEAFYDQYLTYLRIPPSVITIENNAFGGRHPPTCVCYEGNAPSMSSNSFGTLALSSVAQCGSSTTCSAQSACPNTPTQVGYTISAGSSTVTSTRTVACDTGYSGTASTITCQSSETWTLATGCAIRDCGTPVASTGYSISAGTTTTYLSSYTMSCASGFSGTATSITCQSDGLWSSSSGCTIRDCGTVTPETGYANGSGLTTFGSSFTMSCASGYTGTAASLVCQSDGTWTAQSGCAIVDGSSVATSSTTFSSNSTNSIHLLWLLLLLPCFVVLFCFNKRNGSDLKKPKNVEMSNV